MAAEPSYSLADLADKFRVVYLDTNTFFEDRNRAREGGYYPSFSEQLINYRNGSTQIRSTDIDQHQVRIEALLDAIREKPNIVAVAEITSEYDQSIEHMKERLNWLKRIHRGHYNGMVPQISRICGIHEQIYQSLIERISEEEGGELLIRGMLKDGNLHLSKDTHYIKKNGKTKEETLERDIALVGTAIQSAINAPGEIAIVSTDNDIFNLVRNVGERYRDNSPLVPGTRLQSSVKVYTPHDEHWHPGLVTAFQVDTETNVRLRFAPRRARSR